MLENLATLTGLTLLHGTALALLTWLVCKTLLRRAGPAISGVLWTIVLLKFLFPPILPGEMAMSGFLSRAFLGASYEAPTADPSIGNIEAPVPTVAERAGNAAPLQFLATMWGLAVVLLGVRFAIQAGCDWRRFRRLPPASAESCSEVRRLCRRMGLRRLPRVVATPDGSSPFVTGFVAPTLALPETMLARLQPAARQALILHELAHIRRGDLFVRALQTGARILLFFWPPVWWVCRRIERSAEMACDQWAVAVSRIEPHVYAGSLLEVVKSISMTRRARGQLAFARQGQLLEERFEMILKRKDGVSPRLSWLAIPGLALWATFALAGGAGQQAQGTPEKQKKEAVRVIMKSGDKTRILRFGKDADLDGDGVISEQEIEDYMLIHPELAEHKIRVHLASADGASENAFVWEQAADKILEIHPEADANHDGKLSEDEAKEFAKAMHGSEDGRINYFFSATVDSEDGLSAAGKEPNVIFIGRDGTTERIDPDTEGEWTTPSGDRLIVRHGDAATIKELDTDNDGEVSLEEARAYAAAHDGEEGERTVLFLKRVPDEGLHELTEAEALGRGEKLAQARRENLLRKHPEADLDGDGVISQEEAKALAAKLQAKSKKP